MSKLCLLLALCTVAAPALSQTQPAVPGWQDLEDAYGRDGNIDGAQRQISGAIPVGTPTQQAVAALTQAGAGCKPKRHAPNIERCLIHQYSLADGAADDIRWTISLDTMADRIGGVSVDRYVDRHGTN